jgi:orotidine-5'-phosphate decarboxylase
MRHFADRLHDAIRRKGNAVLVGIDPRPKQFPPGLLDRFPADSGGYVAALRAFAREVIDIVAPFVPAVKFQSAFFEQHGPDGIEALHDTMAHARQLDLIVIFDGKRNDIGPTAEAYAEAYLEPSAWSADAITVNPYLGSDGILPFIEVAKREGKGVYPLVRTSNPSAREFQDLVADGLPLYRHVARKVAEWGKLSVGEGGYSAVGAVVGATYPAELAELRADLPKTPFLIPGYGAQGGGAGDVAAAFDAEGLGGLINNSRGILYAYEKPAYRERFGPVWERAIEQAVIDMAADLAAHKAGPASA